MKDNFYEVIEKRRSIYGLGNHEVVPEDKIVSIVNHMVKYCPSAFNSQSGRVVVLFKKNHLRLWDIVKEALRQVVPAANFAQTEAKIDSFAKGYATILFFEDEDVVGGLQQKFSAYADNFPKWSMQSSGMLQYLIWAALENEGAGVSLQHYNPLIDEAVMKEWNLPSSWKLISQMPIGNVETPAGEKSFEPIEKRVKVFK